MFLGLFVCRITEKVMHDVLRLGGRVGHRPATARSVLIVDAAAGADPGDLFSDVLP